MGKRTAGILVATGTLVLLPTAAIAGRKVVRDGQSLRITATIDPARAHARDVVLGLHATYLSTVKGKRISGATSQVSLALPPGMKLHPNAAGKCHKKKFIASKFDPSVCPSSSVVGGGSVTVDARPTLPNPVAGTAKLYNLTGGSHKPGVLLFVTVKIGSAAVTAFEFYRLRHVGTGERLVTRLPRPAQGSSSAYTIRTIDLKFHDASTHKSFVTAPPTCSGSWRVALGIRSFDNQPKPIAARDRVRCHQ